MASTSRKWAGAISVGIVTLALVLWLANRRPTPVASPLQPPVTALVAPLPHPTEKAAVPPAPLPAIAEEASTAPAPVAATPKLAPAKTSGPTPVATTQTPKEPNLDQDTPAPTTASPSVQPANEIAAAERMYMAHASLRTPEDANPDSTTNRQILQTMIAKALHEKAAAKPAALPTQ